MSGSKPQLIERLKSHASQSSSSFTNTLGSNTSNSISNSSSSSSNFINNNNSSSVSLRLGSVERETLGPLIASDGDEKISMNHTDTVAQLLQENSPAPTPAHSVINNTDDSSGKIIF